MRKLISVFWGAVIMTVIPGVSGAFGQTTYSLPAPAGIQNGDSFVLFGQGWGKTLPVQGGKVRLPGDLNAQAIFGNFRRLDGNWLDVGSLSGVPAGWAARIIAGQCQGDKLACDGVEAFLDKDTFALVAPIATDKALSSFTVGWRQGYASLQLPLKLNSVSFSGAGGSRQGLGLPTGGLGGLVNVGQLLREATPVVVLEQGGLAVIVPARHQGGGLWTAPVPSGTVFQWAYQGSNGNFVAWSTVGAARLSGGVTRLNGNAPSPVGPYAYQAPYAY